MRAHWSPTSRLRLAALTALALSLATLPAFAQHGGAGHSSGGGGHSSGGGFSGGSSAPHFSSSPSGYSSSPHYASAPTGYSSAPHYASAPTGYSNAPHYSGAPGGLRQPGVRGTYASRTGSVAHPPLTPHYGTTSSSHSGPPNHNNLVSRTNATSSSPHATSTSAGSSHSSGNHGSGWNNHHHGYNGYSFPYGGYFGPIYNPYLFYPWLDADLSWDFWHNTGDSDDAIAAASVGADAYGPAPDDDSTAAASQAGPPPQSQSQQSQSAQSSGDPSQNEALSQAELEAQQADVERATIAADGPRVNMVQGVSSSPGMTLVYKSGQQELIDNYVISRSSVTITDRAGHITTIPTSALNVVATNQANAALGNGLVLSESLASSH